MIDGVTKSGVFLQDKFPAEHWQASVQTILFFLQEHIFVPHPFLQLHLIRLIIALGAGGLSMGTGSKYS